MKDELIVRYRDYLKEKKQTARVKRSEQLEQLNK